ncbi:MAG: hypothetical protein H6918_10770 [Sphingomonadaceae bacterium]|nr:hypothetical protein [Sphingomonadaceae bacterium]
MTKHYAKSGALAFACAIAAGLSACAAPDYELADASAIGSGPRPVETMGETIARNQQGDDGCLVAGNLDKGRKCRDLRKSMEPPTLASEKQR